MKFKCRKRKKPSKHKEESGWHKRQGGERGKAMGTKHKYWRANWIFICGAQKVKMRVGVARVPTQVPKLGFILFLFLYLFLFSWSTALCDGPLERHTLHTERLSYLHLQQFYFMVGGGPQHFCFLCSTDFRVGMWNMLIPSDYNCCIPGPRPAYHTTTQSTHLSHSPRFS